MQIPSLARGAGEGWGGGKIEQSPAYSSAARFDVGDKCPYDSRVIIEWDPVEL